MHLQVQAAGCEPVVVVAFDDGGQGRRVCALLVEVAARGRKRRPSEHDRENGLPVEYAQLLSRAWATARVLAVGIKQARARRAWLA